MIKNIMQVLNSGRSKRWHNNVDMNDHADDLAQHQWSVAMIFLYLNPQPSVGALFNVLTHDVGEVIAGDLSYDFKINNKEAAEAHKKAEQKYKDAFVQEFAMTKDEKEALKFADWLSSYWWVSIKKPEMLSRHDWVEQKEHMIKETHGTKFAGKFDNLVQQIDDTRLLGCSKKPELDWVFAKVLDEYKAA